VVERSGNELRITLSRPARRNAVDWRMRDALTAALAAAAREPGMRVVLTGAGPDFCAGGDLDEFGSRPDPATAHLVRLTRSPALLLHQLSARTTARVHGACARTSGRQCPLPTRRWTRHRIPC
jgi:enoyl-CoA hydratase/carnithine racemase